MSNLVYVMADFKAKKGRLDDLKATLQTLADETRTDSEGDRVFLGSPSADAKGPGRTARRRG